MCTKKVENDKKNLFACSFTSECQKTEWKTQNIIFKLFFEYSHSRIPDLQYKKGEI